MGKSRLVYEFTHSHRLQGWLVLESCVGLVRQGDELPAGDRPPQGLLQDPGPGRPARDPGEGDGQAADPRRSPEADAAGVAGPARRARGRCRVARRSTRPSAASGRSTPSSALLLREAKSSRSCSSSRICTGSTPRPRRCSTRWSRACRRRALLCSSTTVRSTSTAGEARPTTRSSGSMRCRSESAESCCTRCSATTQAWSLSSSS